ncbi:MAG: alkaline phosphatase D family protein [Bacteroidota bacterium]
MTKGLNIPITIFCILSSIPLLCVGQPYGAKLFKAEKVSPGLHMIAISDLKMAFLLDSVGRYVYHWYFPSPKLQQEFERSLDVKIPALSSKVRDTLSLANGNMLVYNASEGKLSEFGPRQARVWEYTSPFLNEEDTPFYLNYLGTFAPQRFPNLNLAPPFTQTEIKQARRQVDTTGQYKKLHRETVAEIEAGYWDDAQRYLDTFLVAYPQDLEALYAMTLLQTVRKQIPLALQWARKSLDAGLPLSRFTANLHGMFSPLLEQAEFKELGKTYASTPLIHGPMLGKLSDTSISVWVRTAGEVNVQLKCFEKSGKEVGFSAVFTPQANVEYTGVGEIRGLESGQEYAYEVWINDEKVSQRHVFTTSSSKGKNTHFTLGFSGGAGYTPRFERMWDTLSTHNFDLFLLLGDNVYIDHPERPGTQKYCYYRRQSRPEYQRFTAETPIYAIWDDHDFTYNDERGGPEINEPYWKQNVWEVFQNQWVNPYYGGGRVHPGCYTDFSVGDVDFFLLDCRYYREDPKKKGASMLGPVQKAWLKEKLKNSQATFKVIASSVPWANNTKPGSLDTWDGHPEEREEIFSFIEDERIEGVLLIAADRHRSDAWKIERPNGYDFYDLMSSKLTNVHTHKVMHGSLFGYNKMCSFGVLEFDTTREDPQVQYRVYNIENEEIHRLTLYRSQFSFD